MNDESIIVNSSSTVEIEKEGRVKVIPFESGVSSDYIVTTSLESIGLSDVTPQYVQNQIVNSINTFEQYANDNPTVETEHSFQFNFGVFKYGFKRKTTRRK